MTTLCLWSRTTALDLRQLFPDGLQVEVGEAELFSAADFVTQPRPEVACPLLASPSAQRAVAAHGLHHVGVHRH